MNWQSLIAMTLVIIAAAWLGRRLYRIFKRLAGGPANRGDCGSCGNNPMNPPDQEVVSITPLHRVTK